MKTNCRWVALTTLILFLCGEVSPLLAGSVPSAFLKPTAEEILIPSEWGRVEEYHPGTSGRTVYFVQDAHDSLEIQENIARLIHYLVAKDNVDTVFEEGFEGPVPTDEYFNFIHNPLTKERVAHYLLDRLEIGGAEYAHITRQKDFALIGADSRELQLKTLQKYREATLNRKIIEEDLSKLEEELERLAAIYFPENIKRWMKLKKRYGEGAYDIILYLQRIQSLFGEEMMRRLDQVKMLLEVSEESAVDLEVIKSISAVELFDEVNQLENRIRERFLDSANQKTISQYYQVVQSLKRLNAAEISFPEFKSVREALHGFTTEQVVRFIAALSKKPFVLSKEWERHIKRAKEFYVLAGERDIRVAQSLRRHEFQNAILVFGGFHKSNLKTILKEQGHAFYVISPQMNEVSSEHTERYRELMAGGLEGFKNGFSLNRQMRYLPVMAADYWDGREHAQLRILNLKNRIEDAQRSELREYNIVQENYENFYVAITTLGSTAYREDRRSRKEVFISFSNYLSKKFEMTTLESINAEELYELIIGLIREKYREIPNYRAQRDYFIENFQDDLTVRFMENFSDQNPAILLIDSEEALDLKPARRWALNIWFHRAILSIKQKGVLEALMRPFVFGRVKELFQKSPEELTQRIEVLERSRRAFTEAPFSYVEYSKRVRPYRSNAEQANVQLEVLGEIEEPVAIFSNRAKYAGFNLRSPVTQSADAKAEEKVILVGEDELVLYPAEMLGRHVLSTIQAKCCGIAAGKVQTDSGENLYLMSHQLPTGFALTLNVLERLFENGQIQSADLIFIVSDRETKLENLQLFKERFPGFNYELVESKAVRRGVTLTESSHPEDRRYLVIHWEEPWVRYSDETPVDFSLGYSSIIRDHAISEPQRSEVRDDNQSYLTANVINKGWSEYKNELSEEEMKEFRFVAEGLETKEEYLAELKRLNDPTFSFVTFRALIDKIDAYPKEKFVPLHNYLWDQTAQFFLDTARFGDDEDFKEARMKFLQPYISFHIMSSGDKTREELSKRALLAFARHYDRNIFYPAFHELLNNLLAFGRTYSEMNFSEVPEEKRRIIDLTVELLTADSNSPGYAQAISNLFKWMWGHITSEDQRTRDSFKKVLNYVLHSIERRRPELAQTIRIMYERGSQKGVITKTVLEGIGFWRESVGEGDSVVYTEYADSVKRVEDETRFTLSPGVMTLGFDEGTVNQILEKRAQLGAVYEKNISMALRLGKQYRTFATIDSDHALTSIDFEFYERVKRNMMNGLSETIMDEFNRIHRHVWFTRGVELHAADPTFSRRALYRRDTLVTVDLLEDSYKKFKDGLSQAGIHTFDEYYFAYILYLGRFVNGKDGYLAALLLEYYYQTTYFDKKGDVIPALREAEELLRKSLQDILSHSPKFHVRDANWMESDGTRIAQSVYWVDSATWPDRRPVVVVPSLGPQDISSRAIAYTIVQKGYVVLVYDISGFGRTIPYKYDHFSIHDYAAARGEGMAHIMQESYKKAPAELNLLLDRIAHWPQADRHRIAIAGHHGTQWFVNLFNPNPEFRPHLADIHGEVLSEIDSLQTRIQHVWFVRSPYRFNEFYDPLLQATPHNVQLERLMKFPEFLNAAERDLPIKVFADLSFVSRVLNPYDSHDQLEAIQKIISGERVIREVIGSARWITGLMKTSPIYSAYLADQLFAYFNLREAWFRDFEIEAPQSLEEELGLLTDDEIESRLTDESLYEKPMINSGQEYEIRPHPAKMNLNMKEIAALRLVGEDVLGFPIEMTMAEYLESRGIDINVRRRVFPLVRKLLFFYDLDTGLIQTLDPNIEGISESIKINFDETGKRVLSDAGAIGKPEQEYIEKISNKKLLFAVNYRSDDLLLPSLATAKMVLNNNRPLIVVNQSGDAKIWVSKGRVSADEFAALENHATGWHSRVYNYLASSDIQIMRSEARETITPEVPRSELRTLEPNRLRDSALLKRSASVFMNAEDFRALTQAQKNEFLFLAGAANDIRIIFYNHEFGMDPDLESLSRLKEVVLTPLSFEEAHKQHNRSKVPALHLSREYQVEAALIKEYEDRLSFFKTVGDHAGTLTAALLWALDGRPEFNLYGITRRDDGLYTVSQNFVASLSQTFENNLAFAWSA